MTPDTAAFLLWLLDRQTITVGDPDAPGIAAKAFTARAELIGLIEGASDGNTA